MKPLKKFFELLVITDIYASLISVAIIAIVTSELNIEFDWLAAGLVFFQTFAIYALNRQIDSHIDEINLPGRTRFVKSYGLIFVALALIGFVVTMVYAYFSNFLLFVILLINFIASLMYHFHIVPKNIFGFSRFKDVLYGKNIAVGGMYAIFAFVPVINADLPITESIIFLAIFFFIRFFIVSTIFDVRDVEGDSKANIPTIPVTHGKHITLKYMHGLNILTVLLGTLSFAFGLASFSFLLMTIGVFLFAIYYLAKSHYRDADMQYICGVLVEADVIAALLIVFIF